MPDEKEKKTPAPTEPTEAPKNGERSPTWVEDMKSELEDYIEEQGIYIRQ